MSLYNVQDQSDLSLSEIAASHSCKKNPLNALASLGPSDVFGICQSMLDIVLGLFISANSVISIVQIVVKIVSFFDIFNSVGALVVVIV